jgi:Fe-S-cluster containining protein
MSSFLCKKCGSCCKIFTFPVQDVEGVKKFFREHFGFSLKTWAMKVVVQGECEHLKNNRCEIYESRPDKCKDYLCKRHTALEIPDGQLYEKRCRVCDAMRTFQKGTERDKQSVCGNCWVW